MIDAKKTLGKYKHVMIVVVAALAIASYMLPIEALFASAASNPRDPGHDNGKECEKGFNSGNGEKVGLQGCEPSP